MPDEWRTVIQQLAPINADICQMMHTHNLGLPLFTSRNLMRLYLLGYQKGKMDGPIELGFDRIRQVYKKYKTELDTLARSVSPVFNANWLEYYVNDIVNRDLGERLFSL